MTGTQADMAKRITNNTLTNTANTNTANTGAATMNATVAALLATMTPAQQAAFVTAMAPAAPSAPSKPAAAVIAKPAAFLSDLEIGTRNELEKLGKTKIRILVSRFGYGLLAALAKWGGEAEVTAGMVGEHIHAPLAKISVGEEMLLGDAKRFRDILAGFHTAYRRHTGGMAAMTAPNTATAEQAEAIRLRNAAVVMMRDMIEAAMASAESGTLGATGRKRFTDAFVAYVEALGATNENRFRVIVCNLAGSNGETIADFATPYSDKAEKPKASDDKPAEAGDKAETAPATEGGEKAPDAPATPATPDAAPPATPATTAEPKAATTPDTAGTGATAMPMNSLLLSVKATLDAVMALAEPESKRLALRALEGLEAEVHAAVTALKADLAKGKPAKAAATTLPPLASEAAKGEAPKAAGKGKPGGPASVSEKRDMAVQGQTLLAEKLGNAIAAKAASEGGNIPPAAVAADVAKRKNANANSRKAR